MEYWMDARDGAVKEKKTRDKQGKVGIYGGASLARSVGESLASKSYFEVGNENRTTGEEKAASTKQKIQIISLSIEKIFKR